MLTEPVVLLLLAAVIIVVIRLAWSAKTPRHGNKKSKNLARLRSSGQYRGVSIRNGNCSASKCLCGQGFRLSGAQPERRRQRHRRGSFHSQCRGSL